MQHNIRDKNGRFTKLQANNFVMSPELAKALVKGRNKPESQKVNHVAIILDRSGSMQGISRTVVDQFNKQVETLKEESRKYNIKTYLSLYTFSYNLDSPIYKNRPIDTIARLDYSEFRPDGQTALRDAIGGVIADFEYIKFEHGTDNSLLIITITDGLENHSSTYSYDDIRRCIITKNATDRWTFTILCPASSVGAVETQLGILRGNIQPWEATEYGTRIMGSTVRASTQSYYGARASGATKTMSFFTPDLSSVTGTALKKQLQDQSQDFLRLNVTSAARIDEFVQKTTGNKYVLGSGLYQLTKQENVQDYKKIVVQNKNTNQLYSGISDVRSLLKLPGTGTIKLRPTAHPEYIIFVQSTAPNRKLLAGTTLLLDKSLI